MKNNCLFVGFKFILIFNLFYVLSCQGFKYHDKLNVKIGFIGDIIMHNPIKRSINILYGKNNKYKYNSLFEKIKCELIQHDVIISNMEFPIKYPYVNSKSLIFNCDPYILNTFKYYKMNIVNIANNHILDQGIDGFISTLNILKKFDIKYCGAGYKGEKRFFILKLKNINVGIISATGILNYRFKNSYNKHVYLNNFYDAKTINKQIKSLKDVCDIVILIAHYGDEYKKLPNKNDIKLIKEYCENGIDIFIGHHPHVIQPVQEYKTHDNRLCTIFYSLGNFISNQNGIYYNDMLSTNDGLLVTLNINKIKDSINYNFIVTIVHTVKERKKVNFNSKKHFIINAYTIPLSKYIESLNANNKNRNKNDLKKLVTRYNFLKKHLFYYGKCINVFII